MAHVELTLSGLAAAGRSERSVDLWVAAVERAAEPCALLDRSGKVIALSPGCAALFRIDAAAAAGQPLVDGVLKFHDFNPVSGDLPGWDVSKIPCLLAITSQGLARGLLRVSAIDGAVTTVDAISTPVRDGGIVVGSLTFFAPVGR